MARRPKRPTLMIPGLFSKEEQDAAFALQKAGIPHPRIDDEAWALIERRWAELPRIWGRGPWVTRDEHIAFARTTGDLSARVYRVTTELWGLELWGTPTGSGVHRGSLDELLGRAIAAWPPAPPGADQPTEADKRLAAAYNALKARTTHDVALPAADWIEAPTVGPVILPVLEGFQGTCDVSWEGAEDGAAMTPAQERAARTLIQRADELCDELLDGLYQDQRDFDEDPDYPKAKSPVGIMKNVELRGIHISRDERDGLAYTDFSFSDSWRIEHGLCAIMHGTRLVSVGGYGDTRHDISADGGKKSNGAGVEGPTRTPDGARIADRWVQHPYDAVVALPMWEGFRGRWDVRFLYEDEDDLALTDAQCSAAQKLVEDGAGIRDALLARLFRSWSKTGARTTPEPSGLRDVIEANKITVHAEDREWVAYTEFSVKAPWRKFGRATVVMHGARVVALTTKAKVQEVIDDDLDAHLRAVRAAKARKKKTARR